ncbi:MAG: hypothetical protein ACSLE1_03170 [Sphingobium sp.]
MTDKDVIDMTQRCIEEISMLRDEVARLAPKADAYDAITSILGLLPRPSQGYGEDIVWRLKKQIAELTANAVAPEPAEPS